MGNCFPATLVGCCRLSEPLLDAKAPIANSTNVPRNPALTVFFIFKAFTTPPVFPDRRKRLGAAAHPCGNPAAFRRAGPTMLPRGHAKESAARRTLPQQGLSSPGRQTLYETIPGPSFLDGDDGGFCSVVLNSIRFRCR